MAERKNMVATSPDYVGVLAQMDSLRLVVSARGASYDVQRPESGGEWRTLRALPELRFLWDWCCVNGVEIPPEFEAAVGLLPNEPGDCLAIPYAGGKRSA